MKSVSSAVTAVASDTLLDNFKQDEAIAAEAELFANEHGAAADIAAAFRADTLFRLGKNSEAEHWLQIFRAIARSRISRAQGYVE